MTTKTDFMQKFQEKCYERQLEEITGQIDEEENVYSDLVKSRKHLEEDNTPE